MKQVKLNQIKPSSKLFPEHLKNIAQPPKQLYWYGMKPEAWLNKPKVAVVGSRLVSPYGRGVTEKLVGELSRAGVVIVSGLALGMDSIAHQSAINNNGITVAVLPCGIDRIYPARHRSLAIKISRSGCIVTENPPNTPIFKYSFVKRNRIVAGLADALLITEAGIKSGTMHTARFALEQGTTVMAVPGNISNPGSAGCNALIKAGAIPVTDAADIFFELGISIDKQSSPTPKTGDKKTDDLLSLIASGITDQEELAIKLELAASELAGILTRLEIDGHIRPTGGGQWQIG